MKMLTAIWKFSRPHTIIGSTISIGSLYLILSRDRLEHLPFLFIALLAGVSGNIFIVGMNQVADIEIDRINKPWLPIPSQQLTIRQGKIIAAIALILSLALSYFMTPYFCMVIGIASLIGWAYSMPPFHLKSHHIPAAIAISFVRGVLVNLGAFFVFTKLVDPDAALPINLVTLTVFITVCGIVIAWFKDLPDVKGDAVHNVKTLAVISSPRRAFLIGTFLMSLAYVFMIYVYASSWINSSHEYSKHVLLYGHIVLFTAFILHSFTIHLRKKRSVNRFYKRFWLFFFAEYMLYMVAYV